jgi:hypothetical protein
MYPTFLRRFLSMMVDQAVSIVVATKVATSGLLDAESAAGVAIPIALWLLLEPLLTSLWATPGQLLTRTRVRRHPSLARTGVLRAIWRTLLRLFLFYDTMLHAPRDQHRRSLRPPFPSQCSQRTCEMPLKIFKLKPGRLTLRCSEPAHHKVLGRGRFGVTYLRALARPRASALSPVAELDS